MPAIERVIPLVSHLPTSIRDALVRRLRELDGSRPDRVRGRGFGRADDLVGAGPVSQPRHLARDPQHRRLSRRDRRRSADADPRPRRHHADPHHRGVGLAHDDPPRFRSRGAAVRLLGALHRDRRGLCQLLAPQRRLAAADRAGRRRRRCAGARARGRVRPARLHLSPRARRDPARGHDRDLPDRQRHGLAAEAKRK